MAKALSIPIGRRGKSSIKPKRFGPTLRAGYGSTLPSGCLRLLVEARPTSVAVVPATVWRNIVLDESSLSVDQGRVIGEALMADAKIEAGLEWRRVTLPVISGTQHPFAIDLPLCCQMAFSLSPRRSSGDTVLRRRRPGQIWEGGCSVKGRGVRQALRQDPFDRLPALHIAG